MSTPALRVLDAAGVNYTTHTYDPTSLDDALSYGEAVAFQLGVQPDRLFKTLVTLVDGALTVALVPVSGSLNLKALAKFAGGKKAVMADRVEAERATGYVPGGISPFGQRRKFPVFVEADALAYPQVFVSGGKRGLQIELDPRTFVTLLDASFVDLA